MFIRELQSLLLCTECHNLTAAEEKTLPRAVQSKPALSRSSMSGSDAVDFFDVVFRRDDFLSTKLIHSLCSSSTNYIVLGLRNIKAMIPTSEESSSTSQTFSLTVGFSLIR